MALKTVKGTRDILPDESWQWQNLESILAEASRRSGFEEIRTPIFEFAELFHRGVGTDSDAVGKEMYEFVDKGGDHLALRPELTACVARAVQQSTMLKHQGTLRLWYQGPMFRRERPAKGRYRQFHQYGAELIGTLDPAADVECILLARRIIEQIGLTEYALHINSLGSAGTMQTYRERLTEFLRPQAENLSDDSRRRLDSNPLRILDSKAPGDQALLEGAPTLSSCWSDDDRRHFDRVRELLETLGVPYTLNDRLVRGLDYYRHTTFEYLTDKLGAQNAIGGGGRYDGIATQFGGDDFAGVGLAFGIERLLMLLEEEGKNLGSKPAPTLYIAARDDSDRTLTYQLAEQLRAAGISVVGDLQSRSIKAQMREANRFGTTFSIVIGETERTSRTCHVKHMASGENIESSFEDLASKILQRLSQD